MEMEVGARCPHEPDLKPRWRPHHGTTSTGVSLRLQYPSSSRFDADSCRRTASFEIELCDAMQRRGRDGGVVITRCNRPHRAADRAEPLSTNYRDLLGHEVGAPGDTLGFGAQQ